MSIPAAAEEANCIFKIYNSFSTHAEVNILHVSPYICEKLEEMKYIHLSAIFFIKKNKKKKKNFC